MVVTIQLAFQRLPTPWRCLKIEPSAVTLFEWKPLSRAEIAHSATGIRDWSTFRARDESISRVGAEMKMRLR